jgi:hypothetical protein
MGFPKGSQELPFGRRPRGFPAQAKYNQDKNTPPLGAGIFILFCFIFFINF